MGVFPRYSLGTHLLIAAGLFLAVIGVVVGRNWSTFALMYDNLAAMNEGKEVAEQMRQPEDLLDYLGAHPEKASLVAYDVGHRDEGIFFGADQPRPVVGTTHLLLLAEYGRQAETGDLDPAHRVSLDSLAIYALPGMGEKTHERSIAHWRAENYLQSDSTVALRLVIDAIFRFGDEAAADWLMTHLGRDQVQALPDRWGLVAGDPPLPSSGVHLSWRHDEETPPHSSRQPPPTSQPRTAYADRVYRLVRRLRRDSSFRQQEREQLNKRGTDLSVRDQRALAQTWYPKGTAAAYADLLARTVNETLGSPRISQVMQNYLDTPIEGDSVEAPLASIATKVGVTPGIISFVGYARPSNDRPPRVTALFLEDLPIGLFYHLIQTGLDKGFQLRLLSDSTFFRQVRLQLHQADTTAVESRGM